MGMAQKMKNEKFIYLFIVVLLFFLFSKTVLAESNYVLPYPSNMPGSLAYDFHLIFEQISKYWYFGDFGQFNYNLKMTDKYLVEAKILFEYKQYLLAHRALKKSDLYFLNIKRSLLKAEKENKNIINKRFILKEASRKHIEILEKIDSNTPDIFIWEPEKALPTTLHLKKAIEDSVNIRKNSL